MGAPRWAVSSSSVVGWRSTRSAAAFQWAFSALLGYGPLSVLRDYGHPVGPRECTPAGARLAAVSGASVSLAVAVLFVIELISAMTNSNQKIFNHVSFEPASNTLQIKR